MPLVSVIVPAYNASQYISECIDSVLSQSFSDLELIVVDDGSTDNTVEIVESYLNEDSRISLLRLKHSNAGLARNSGLEHASGKYLFFLDSDDYIEHNALQLLVQPAEASNLDIVIARSYFLDDITKETSPIDFACCGVRFNVPLSGPEYPDRVFQSFVGWPWDKLFRASFIMECRLRFQEQRSSNDAFFVFMALAKATSIECLEARLIAHRTNNKNSLEHTRSKSWRNALNAVDAIGNTLFSSDVRDSVRISFLNWVSHFAYWNMTSLDFKELPREVIEEFDSLLSRYIGPRDAYYSDLDASFAYLSQQDRIEMIGSYVSLRKKLSAEIDSIWHQTQIYEDELKRLSYRMEELEGELKRMIGENERLEREAGLSIKELQEFVESRRYRFAMMLAAPVAFIRRHLRN